MGLDMYLSAKIYFFEEESLRSISIAGVNPNDIRYLCVDVLYWRKSNWFHSWFVSRVQGGVDDCNVYPVSRENLELLVATINATIEDISLAPILLPPSEGFLFGPTEIEEYYWRDLRNTKAKLEEILSDTKWEHFEYHSSW